MKPDIGIWTVDLTTHPGTKLRVTERVETEEMLEEVLVPNPDMPTSGLTLVGRQVPAETGFVDLARIDEPFRPNARHRAHRRLRGVVRRPEGRAPQTRQDGPGRSRPRCERPPNGAPTGGQGHRHPAGDLPWLRSRPGDAVGQAGTGRGQYPYVVRRSARRTRPESEGHRARSRGDPAGCPGIAGLQCSDVLHESLHHLPAADDHPCPMACASAGRTA